MTQVVVLICCYNGRQYLDDCLGSVLASDDAGIDRRVVMVDNASADGSADYAREKFPGVEVLRLEANGGFVGGNNFGWEYIQRTYPEARYVVLLNADTAVRSGWAAALAGFLESHPEAGAAEAMLLLHPRKDTVNTAGNRSNFLGFGYMTGYGKPAAEQAAEPFAVDFGSGAALMIRAGLLREFGLFDPVMHSYLEDMDLCWRLRLAGKATYTAPAAVVYHKYVVKAPFKAYFNLERNRWWLLLSYYKVPTLMLLLPALLLMEGGQFVFALRHGLLAERLRVYAFFWNRKNLRLLRERRRKIQRGRVVSDRAFAGGFSGVVEFDAVDHPLLRYVGNPILAGYWAVARRVIFW